MNSITRITFFLTLAVVFYTCIATDINPSTGVTRSGPLFDGSLSPPPSYDMKPRHNPVNASVIAFERRSGVVIADALRTTTGSVTVSGSAAPTYGQVMFPTSGTNAIWTTSPQGYWGNIRATTTTVTSTSYAVLSAFSITNAYQATWHITFKGSVKHSATNGSLAIGVFVGGTLQPDTDSFSDAKGEIGTYSVIFTSNIVVKSGAGDVAIHAYTNSGNTATITSGILDTFLLKF